MSSAVSRDFGAMILGNIKLPLVGKDHPATVYEANDSGLDKFVA